MDGGGCFKFVSAFRDQHAVVVSNNHWITAAPLVILFPPPQLEPVQSTHCSLYGLQTNVMHEVRVRCKMLGGKEFGEFGDSVFIHIPSNGKHLPQEAALSLCDLGYWRTALHNNRKKSASNSSHCQLLKSLCWKKNPLVCYVYNRPHLQLDWYTLLFIYTSQNLHLLCLLIRSIFIIINILIIFIYLIVS